MPTYDQSSKVNSLVLIAIGGILILLSILMMGQLIEKAGVLNPIIIIGWIFQTGFMFLVGITFVIGTIKYLRRMKKEPIPAVRLTEKEKQ
jgi:hypothetical protein